MHWEMSVSLLHLNIILCSVTQNAKNYKINNKGEPVCHVNMLYGGALYNNKAPIRISMVTVRYILKSACIIIAHQYNLMPGYPDHLLN